jgi:hypothetical protein
MGIKQTTERHLSPHSFKLNLTFIAVVFILNGATHPSLSNCFTESGKFATKTC